MTRPHYNTRFVCALSKKKRKKLVASRNDTCARHKRKAHPLDEAPRPEILECGTRTCCTPSHSPRFPPPQVPTPSASGRVRHQAARCAAKLGIGLLHRGLHAASIIQSSEPGRPQLAAIIWRTARTGLPDVSAARAIWAYGVVR